MDSLVIVNAYTDIFTQAGTYGYTGNLLNLLASVYLYRCIYIYMYLYICGHVLLPLGTSTPEITGNGTLTYAVHYC